MFVPLLIKILATLLTSKVCLFFGWLMWWGWSVPMVELQDVKDAEYYRISRNQLFELYARYHYESGGIRKPLHTKERWPSEYYYLSHIHQSELTHWKLPPYVSVENELVNILHPKEVDKHQ